MLFWVVLICFRYAGILVVLRAVCALRKYSSLLIFGCGLAGVRLVLGDNREMSKEVLFAQNDTW